MFVTLSVLMKIKKNDDNDDWKSPIDTLEHNHVCDKLDDRDPPLPPTSELTFTM